MVSSSQHLIVSCS